MGGARAVGNSFPKTVRFFSLSLCLRNVPGETGKPLLGLLLAPGMLEFSRLSALRGRIWHVVYVLRLKKEFLRINLEFLHPEAGTPPGGLRGIGITGGLHPREELSLSGPKPADGLSEEWTDSPKHRGNDKGRGDKLKN